MRFTGLFLLDSECGRFSSLLEFELRLESCSRSETVKIWLVGICLVWVFPLIKDFWELGKDEVSETGSIEDMQLLEKSSEPFSLRLTTKEVESGVAFPDSDEQSISSLENFKFSLVRLFFIFESICFLLLRFSFAALRLFLLL